MAVDVSPWRRARGAVGLVLLLVVVGACNGSPARKHDEPAAGALDASAGQFRFDEGTHDVRTGITNNSSQPITVTKATISWSGFQWSVVKLPDEPVPPDQTAAFTSRFGRPNCTARPTEARLVAVINGVRRSLPLRIDEPGLFERLRASACAEERLADAASVAMVIGRSVVPSRGTPFLAGKVLLRRRDASGAAVTVVDLGGSVLFDVLPSVGRRLRPVLLAADARSVTIPIRVGPTQGCNGHTRGNASQPFLFSVYTRTAGDPVHRSIRVPDKETQVRLMDLLDRYCASIAPH